MKASELRVGNWISVMGGTPQQVTAHYIFMMETYVPSDPNEANYEEVTEGVPLTEDWLLKFEFITDDYPYPSYRKGEFRMIQWDDGTWSNFTSGEYAKSIGRNIGYVHQLQNRYFEHEGEELTVKETV